MKLFLTAVTVLVFAIPSIGKESSCCWESLFRQGTSCGTVLYAEGKFPRVKARIQGSVWKGKIFYCDGTMTNRWFGGIHAVSSGVTTEPSWLDGQPCLVIQYAPDAPVFGNVRDEIRQIAPDRWLGRSYDSATGEVKNWFMLRSK